MVVRLIIEMIRPDEGMHIYDPTCGSGGMLRCPLPDVAFVSVKCLKYLGSLAAYRGLREIRSGEGIPLDDV